VDFEEYLNKNKEKTLRAITEGKFISMKINAKKFGAA
jgi:hypothetical protein